MKIGLSIIRQSDPVEAREFTRRAEALGFDAVLVLDHIVLPTAGTNQYPYSQDGSFPLPSDTPILEPLTLLGYLAACTSTIRLGSSVIILPYRNPVVQAKMFASLDVLTGGRMICGAAVGWLEQEFETLGVPYAQRGPLTDEYLQIFKVLWADPEPDFHGRFHNIEGIQFYPKPVQKPHIPIWVGGHSRPALRRAARYGDCWHTTRQTPEFVAQSIPYLRQQAERAGQDPDSISVSLKRALHFTDIGLPGGAAASGTGGAVVGTTQEVIDDLYRCREVGIDQVTYDFQVPSLEHCLYEMEHLADRVLPLARGLE